ncbi:MAG TPA: efflux RND transporter periplasmic adaptor subunit [Acidobacteriaceae bacterium]|nr:efflux RND transporter periplasmic adaptor subunit [Acidobacteriaceae bacterium]
MKYTVVIATAFSLCVLSSCGGAKHDQAAQAPPPVQVETEGGVSLITVDHPDRFPVTAATRYASTSTLNVTGTVNPDVSRTIPVISIASGRVIAIHTQIGAYVKKGQLLMEVQSTDISNAFNQYLKAVNDERLARTQDERAKILYEKGAIAKSQLEIADDSEQDARTDLTAAEQQLQFLGVDPAHPSLTAKVYSPATGVVIAQNVTNAAATGVTFAGSATAFTIADLSEVWIICDVYENDLPMVHVGQTADIRLNAYPDRVVTGTISEIDAVLDPSIRTAKVRIQVPNPDHLMRIGMFATATFHGHRLEDHTSVPASAILHLHDRDWVYAPVGGGKFKRLGVVGGAMLPGGMQEVTSGLAVGQQVVTRALELQNTVDQ